MVYLGPYLVIINFVLLQTCQGTPLNSPDCIGSRRVPSTANPDQSAILCAACSGEQHLAPSSISSNGQSESILEPLVQLSVHAADSVYANNPKPSTSRGPKTPRKPAGKSRRRRGRQNLRVIAAGIVLHGADSSRAPGTIFVWVLLNLLSLTATELG